MRHALGWTRITAKKPIVPRVLEIWLLLVSRARGKEATIIIILTFYFIVTLISIVPGTGSLHL